MGAAGGAPHHNLQLLLQPLAVTLTNRRYVHARSLALTLTHARGADESVTSAIPS